MTSTGSLDAVVTSILPSCSRLSCLRGSSDFWSFCSVLARFWSHNPASKREQNTIFPIAPSRIDLTSDDVNTRRTAPIFRVVKFLYSSQRKMPEAITTIPRTVLIFRKTGRKPSKT